LLKRQFGMQIDKESVIYFVHVLIVKTKLCGQILKWSNDT
jgi:hypothetical protein